MRVVKILGRIVLGLVGLVVVLYLIVLAVNWSDRPPSAAYASFEQTITARPRVPDAENAVVYLLAFSAPADQDPREVGARRFAWLQTYDDQTPLDSDPLKDRIDLKENGSPQVEQLDKDCGQEDRKACVEGFERAARGWQPTATETLALQRYRTLLGFRAWREVMPPHLSAPLPAYGGVMHAQRLYMLSLMQLAEQGGVAELRAGLGAEFDYWRAAQQNAETLIPKMIALAALRNHFFYSNLILRQLPADQVLGAMPPDWHRAFTDEERSLRLVMGGEVIFMKGILDYTVRTSDLVDSMAGTYEKTTMGGLLDYLALPLFKVQDTANHMADNDQRLVEQFAVPMSQYPAAKDAFEEHARTKPHRISIYNPMGDQLLKVDDGTHLIGYAFRTANPEGMRRAVLLVTQLRARGIAADAAATEVANSELRDPYSGSAFTWDTARSSLVFTGREDKTWGRHEFFY